MLPTQHLVAPPGLVEQPSPPQVPQIGAQQTPFEQIRFGFVTPLKQGTAPNTHGAAFVTAQ